MNTNSKIKLNLDSLKARKEWKRHKVKDGHNIFRILPPFGEASNGYPYRKWQIIWGLTDPESGRARPFASSMTSEKRCPVTEFVNSLKDRAETMGSQMKAAGYSDEDIKVRLKDLRELIGNISPKTVYIYNAADKSGEVGLLELKSTAHKDMKEKMNSYIQDYNQDPTSLGSADDDSGVWFDVIRSGTFYETTYKVEKCQSKVKNGNSVSFVDDRSPLPEAVVENYDNLAYDLSTVYQVKTYDELAEILAANLPGITEVVPDADLTVEPSLDLAAAPVAQVAVRTPAARPAATAAAKPAAKVNLNLGSNDEDDSESQTAAPAKPAAKVTAPVAKAAAKVVVDDDFMAEADAILNS
jgi:hypothetical protein